MKNLFYFFRLYFLKSLLTRRMLSFLLLSFLLLPQFACDTTEPISNTTLNLKLEDVSCTEAWIQFSSTNIQIPNNVTLYINNQPKKTINLTTADTLLYVDSLFPNQTYKLKVSNTQYSLASNELSITTIDTTSHNLTWQTFTFGEHSSSVLYDIAIINENDIWAVGKIYVNDSLGNPDPNAYNAVHWDGNNWELKRINMQSSCNPVIYPPLKAIWAFSANHIVVASGGSIGWFNGIVNKTDCSIRPLLSGSINRLWGSSSNDFYAVGSNGNIVNYNGSSWSKIESGTDLNIYDIWGNYDDIDNGYEILAVASVPTSFDRAIFSINPSTKKVTQLSSQLIQYTLNGVWFKNRKHYYVIGDGIYEKNRLNDATWKNKPRDFTEYFTRNISGNDINDIFVCGDFGEILHFNGISWKSLRDDTGITDGIYFSVRTKGNTLVTVGLFGQKAILITGKR